jgi:hypothetical protein
MISFVHNFYTDSISASSCSYYVYPYCIFEQNILPIPILQTLNSNAEETAQNKQSTFLLLKLSLKIKFDNHQRTWRIKLLKLVHPTVHCTDVIHYILFLFP